MLEGKKACYKLTDICVRSHTRTSTDLRVNGPERVGRGVHTPMEFAGKELQARDSEYAHDAQEYAKYARHVGDALEQARHDRAQPGESPCTFHLSFAVCTQTMVAFAIMKINHAYAC